MPFRDLWPKKLEQTVYEVFFPSFLHDMPKMAKIRCSRRHEATLGFDPQVVQSAVCCKEVIYPHLCWASTSRTVQFCSKINRLRAGFKLCFFPSVKVIQFRIKHGYVTARAWRNTVRKKNAESEADSLSRNQLTTAAQYCIAKTHDVHSRATLRPLCGSTACYASRKPNLQFLT